MQSNIFIELLFYFWGGISGLLFCSIAAIETKRLIKKLKWVYNDWLTIAWIISYLIMFLFMMVNLVLDLIADKAYERYRWIWFYLLWFFLKMFEVLSISYPILLVIYYTKLSDLRENKTFSQVKKSINRLELILLSIIWTVVLSYFLLGTLPNIIIYADEQCEVLPRKSHNSKFSTRWIVFNKIRDYAFYYYESLNCVLIIIQIVVFMHIRKTMKSKLHYYYKSAMYELKVLLVSHGTFLVFTTLLNIGFLVDHRCYEFYL